MWLNISNVTKILNLIIYLLEIYFFSHWINCPAVQVFSKACPLPVSRQHSLNASTYSWTCLPLLLLTVRETECDYSESSRRCDTLNRLLCSSSFCNMSVCLRSQLKKWYTPTPFDIYSVPRWIHVRPQMHFGERAVAQFSPLWHKTAFLLLLLNISMVRKPPKRRKFTFTL